jgi:hypothetical protein
MNQGDVARRMMELRTETAEVFHTKGAAAAADYLAAEQYKVVGQMLEAGLVSDEQAIKQVAEIDKYKATFLAKWESL